jgi:hypothetical protein|nr:MAG TPA: hypothetical protein [Caudoviricetes sp.]
MKQKFINLLLWLLKKLKYEPADSLISSTINPYIAPVVVREVKLRATFSHSYYEKLEEEEIKNILVEGISQQFESLCKERIVISLLPNLEPEKKWLGYVTFFITKNIDDQNKI